MWLPKTVNDTVGFANDALPVKAFNTPSAKASRSLAAMALKPMTARIGLIFVVVVMIGISFRLSLEVAEFGRTPLARRKFLLPMLSIFGKNVAQVIVNGHI